MSRYTQKPGPFHEMIKAFGGVEDTPPHATVNLRMRANLAVELTERKRSQCPFPLWPNDAGPSHSDYGLVCGHPITKSGHCAEHAKILAAPARERRMIKQSVSRVVRLARYQGVA